MSYQIRLITARILSSSRWGSFRCAALRCFFFLGRAVLKGDKVRSFCCPALRCFFFLGRAVLKGGKVGSFCCPALPGPRLP